MSTFQVILTWLGLVALLAVEFFLANVPGLRFLVPFIGIFMAILVALTFMRLASDRGLVPVFAIAGLFWLCVLLGLGTLDSFTRHDIPAPQLTFSSEPANSHG